MRAVPLSLTLILLLPGAAAAQGAPGFRDLMNARSLGMGGAYQGLGLSADSVIGNPATMSAFKRYQVELSGAWDFSRHFAFASGSVVDSQTGAAAAGLDYHYVSIGRGEEARSAHFVTMGLAFPLVEALHLGASARYFLMSGAAKANAITVDAGLLIRIGNSLQLGAAGHNLVDTRHSELSRYYTFSAGFIAGMFSLGADLRADFESTPGHAQYLFGTGAEFVIANSIPLRAGYSYDGLTGLNYLSAGAGFFSEGNGLDLGYRQALDGSDRMLLLTVRLQR